MRCSAAQIADMAGDVLRSNEQGGGLRATHLRVQGDTLSTDLVELLLADHTTQGNHNRGEGSIGRHLAHVQGQCARLPLGRNLTSLQRRGPSLVSHVWHALIPRPCAKTYSAQISRKNRPYPHTSTAGQRSVQWYALARAKAWHSQALSAEPFSPTIFSGDTAL
jgi:hypothetical protein